MFTHFIRTSMNLHSLSLISHFSLQFPSAINWTTNAPLILSKKSWKNLFSYRDFISQPVEMDSFLWFGRKQIYFGEHPHFPSKLFLVKFSFPFSGVGGGCKVMIVCLIDSYEQLPVLNWQAQLANLSLKKNQSFGFNISAWFIERSVTVIANQFSTAEIDTIARFLFSKLMSLTPGAHCGFPCKEAGIERNDKLWTRSWWMKSWCLIIL